MSIPFDALARAVAELSRPGDQAELRRLSHEGTPGFAYWKVLSLADAQPWSEADHPAWMVAVSAMASSEAGGASLGAAMAAAGVSERRVLALLRAEAPALYDQVRSVVHLLGSRKVPVRRADWARLLLLQGDAGEKHRRGVASDYFRNISSPGSPS